MHQANGSVLPGLGKADVLLSASNICYSNDDKKILQDVSLEIRTGQIMTVIGPNGGGKTTLIKIILGLTRASSGVIRRAKKLGIGYAPQKFMVDNYLPMTVSSFIDSTLSPTLNRQMVIELTEITELLRSQMGKLSGGELKKVLLAKALLTGHDLIVLDEPVSCLDLNGKDKFYSILQAVNQRFRCAILLVSHDLVMIMKYTDVVLCINTCACCSGSPENVKGHPAFTELFGNTFQNLALYEHDHRYKTVA